MDSLTFDVSEDEGADKRHDDNCHRQREVRHQLPFAGVEEGPAERGEVERREDHAEGGEVVQREGRAEGGSYEQELTFS